MNAVQSLKININNVIRLCNFEWNEENISWNIM